MGWPQGQTPAPTIGPGVGAEHSMPLTESHPSGWGTKDQRGEVICPRLHGAQTPEPSPTSQRQDCIDSKGTELPGPRPSGCSNAGPGLQPQMDRFCVANAVTGWALCPCPLNPLPEAGNHLHFVHLQTARSSKIHPCARGQRAWVLGPASYCMTLGLVHPRSLCFLSCETGTKVSPTLRPPGLSFGSL